MVRWITFIGDSPYLKFLEILTMIDDVVIKMFDDKYLSSDDHSSILQSLTDLIYVLVDFFVGWKLVN